MKNFDIRIRNGGDDAIAAVSELMAGRWIPVEERLPDEGEPVLAAWPQHDNVVGIAWTLSPTRWEDIEGFIDPPSHWQPLPKPPAT